MKISSDYQTFCFCYCYFSMWVVGWLVVTSESFSNYRCLIVCLCIDAFHFMRDNALQHMFHFCSLPQCYISHKMFATSTACVDCVQVLWCPSAIFCSQNFTVFVAHWNQSTRSVFYRQSLHRWWLWFRSNLCQQMWSIGFGEYMIIAFIGQLGNKITLREEYISARIFFRKSQYFQKLFDYGRTMANSSYANCVNWLEPL